MLTVMRRLVFITETAIGSSVSSAEATNKTRNELKGVWIYAGYEDILKKDAGIDRSIKVSLSLFNIVIVFIMLDAKSFIREPQIMVYLSQSISRNKFTLKLQELEEHNNSELKSWLMLLVFSSYTTLQIHPFTRHI